MRNLRLRHRIEYTRNKHSRAVYRGNTIIIRLAKNLSKTEEHDHIQSLLRRMTHLVLQEKSKTIIDPFRSLLDGAQSATVRTASGKSYVFSLFPAKKTHTKKTTRGWTIYVSPTIRRRALHRILWNLLAESEEPRLTDLIHAINKDTYRGRISSVRVSFATTQWGSCSPKGIIMLNIALAFLPRPLLRYVIVHELAHMRVPNHSATFWKEVEKMMPDYDVHYKKLQEYRLPQL